MPWVSSPEPNVAAPRRYSLGSGQEFQRQAPACWTATLHRGGVLRMKTGPGQRASAGLAQGRTPEIVRGRHVLLSANAQPLRNAARSGAPAACPGPESRAPGPRSGLFDIPAHGCRTAAVPTTRTQEKHHE
jgi:hypothetical protein